MPDIEKVSLKDGYVAVVSAYAARGVEIAKISCPDPTGQEDWYPYPDAQVYLGFFLGDYEDCLASAAEYACTSPDNITLIPLASASMSLAKKRRATSKKNTGRPEQQA